MKEKIVDGIQRAYIGTLGAAVFGASFIPFAFATTIADFAASILIIIMLAPIGYGLLEFGLEKVVEKLK